MGQILTAMILTTLLWTCEKNPTGNNGTLKPPQYDGAFIVNEGAWGASNGSLSFYEFGSGAIQNAIFKNANPDYDEPLGDVVQSVAVIDTFAWVVVNQSHKIELIGLRSWKHVTTINLPGGSSPRQIVDGGNGKAYVTLSGQHAVGVIDIEQRTLRDETIAVGRYPYEMLVINNRGFVVNSGWGNDSTVSVLDLENDRVSTTINVRHNPTALALDESGLIHVLCTGRYAFGNQTATDGAIYTINPANARKTDSLLIAGHPTHITIGNKQTGYFIHNNQRIVSYATDELTILNDSLATEPDYPYGLEADIANDRIFVLDALDLSQKGFLYIYNPQGVLQETHRVGIAPGSVTFVTLP